MHIRQIIIENFRSYKGRHVLDNLHPGHNAIVGRNGSGKSSLLECITFVLSNRYYPISREQRAAVINDDHQKPARSASVELIIADPDNLLSLSTPEVRIRREVFHNSDYLTVNNVRFSHSELSNLTSTVFPRENPYYILRQNEVAVLATGSDSTRLDVISTAVGVHKFEEGFAELLNEIAKKQRILEEKRNEIRSHREKLETMHKQYNEWLEVNTTKRYLEHRRCKLYVDSLRSELSDLEESYQVEHSRADEARAKYESLNDEYFVLCNKVSSIQTEMANLEKIKKKTKNEDAQLSEELDSLEYEKKEIEAKLQGPESAVKKFTEHKQNLDGEILRLQDEYEDKVRQLNETEKALERSRRDLERFEYQLIAQHRRRTRVLELQLGNGEANESMFSSSQYDREIEAEKKKVEGYETEAQVASDEKTRLEEELKVNRNQQNGVKLLLQQHKRDKEDSQKVRDNLLAKKKEKQREADELHDKLETLIKKSATMKRRLQSVIRSDILEGIESVRKVVEIWKQQDNTRDDVEGIKGLLLELFTCEQPNVVFPVEVTGGEQLFYHVVRNREIVDKVTGEMKEQKFRGIVNFIPLDDIRVPQLPQAPPNQAEWQPMVSFLSTEDEDSRKAVEFVFGKTAIVRDLATGINISKSKNLQCITLDGQQVLGAGMFRGGYRDREFSRVDFYEEFIQTRNKIEESGKNYKQLLSDIRQIDKDLIDETNKLRKLDFKIIESQQHIEKLQIDKTDLSNTLDVITKSYNSLKMHLESSKVRLEETRHEKSDVRVEVEDLDQTLQDIDTSMEELRQLIVPLEQEKRQAEMIVPNLVSNLESLKNILSNLAKDQEKLEDQEDDFSEDLLNQRLTFINARKELCENYLKDVKEKLEKVNNRMNELAEELLGFEEALREMKVKKEKAQLVYKEAEEDAEDIESKYKSLEDAISEWEEKARLLGTIPTLTNSARYDTWNKQRLTKEIRKLAQQENRIGVVAGVEDRMKLLEDELKALEALQKKEEEAKRICEMKIQTISEKRVRALKNGFEVINGYFREIFGGIVNNGRASLFPVNQVGEESVEANWNWVRGIRIRATFVGEREMDRMYQFSGGQKTLIALTLIFAIHMYRPIPFYLFDEVDKALDGNYRAAIAGFVHRLSRETQFLTITFRGELLRQADKYFKVIGRNDCSYVEDCARDEAMGFVRGEADQE